jgi:hypothetical protein
MPRVVIELQANTQQAVAQIQQFSKATRDSFDAIRAGNPALADASVKVSTLTQATAKSSIAFSEFRNVAKGFMGDIPVIGGFLTRLTDSLGGFVVGVGAAVGAGYAFLKMLQGWNNDATAALAAITKLSQSIQTDFQTSILQVAKIRAQAAGDEGKVITTTAALAIKAAEEVRDAKIAAIEAELKKVDEFGRQRTEYTDQEKTALLAAETKYQGDLRVIEAQGMADLDKLGAQRVAAREAELAKETAAVEAAAAKEKAIWTQTTQDAIAIFQGLGAGFEDALKPLQLEQQVEKWQQQIATLNTAIDQGRDTSGNYAKAIEVITQKMQEAIALGYVPTIEKAKELTVAVTETAEAAEDAGERWLRSMEGVSATMDDIIAKTRAAGAAASGGTTSRTLVTGGGITGGGTTGGGSAIDISGLLGTIGQISAPYQHGGLVPGSGPVPIVAHGGEVVIPTRPGRVSAEAGGGESVMIRIEPGAVQLSGTIIDQQRGWGSLVEELGQALEARLRRRAR